MAAAASETATSCAEAIASKSFTPVTVAAADLALGFDADLRRYDVCKPMLEHLGVRSLRLMSNSPAKVEAVRASGVEVAERVGIEVGLDESNLRYLRTKQARMGHLFSMIEDETQG